MPQYTFLCRARNKEFSKILTISEYEKGGIVCPHCKRKELCSNFEEELVKGESPGSHQRSRNSRQRKKQAGRGILPARFSVG